MKDRPLTDGDIRTRIATAHERYVSALHAVQSAIRFEMEADGVDADQPVMRMLKHLRVGIDSQKVEQAAFADLLISKGLITEVEYYEKLAARMEREVLDAETKLAKALGQSVKLR